MTERQRQLVAAMEPGKWHEPAELVTRLMRAGLAGPGLYTGVYPVVRRLERGGFVRRGGRRRVRLTKAGEALWLRVGPELVGRLAAPPAVAPRPAALRRAPFRPGRSDAVRGGPLFMCVRVLRCWLEREGYRGRGHGRCGLGVQGGHTAHHVGRLDAEGLIPGCGLAHDLYAGLGSAATRAEFERWMLARGFDLGVVALAYVEGAAVRAAYRDDEVAR